MRGDEDARGLGAAQADARAAQLERNRVAERRAPHDAHRRAGDEAEVEEPAADAVVRLDARDDPGLARREAVERHHRTGVRSIEIGFQNDARVAGVRPDLTGPRSPYLFLSRGSYSFSFRSWRLISSSTTSRGA